MKALAVFRLAFWLGVHDFRVFWGTWKMWVFTWVLRVTTAAAMWVLLGRLLGSEERVRFLLIGQAVIVGPQAAGWVAAASSWDRTAGTYPLLVIAPSSLVPPMLGRTSVWILNGIASSLSTFLILGPLFGLQMPVRALLLLPILIAVVCCSFYGLNLFLGSLVVRVPSLRNLVHNVASIVTMAIGGVVVPVTFWPEPVQLVANILPVTHGLASIRLLLDGGPAIAVARGALIEALIGAVWLAIGVLTIDVMAEAGRRDGSIEFGT